MEPAPRNGSRAAHGWLTAAIICVHVLPLLVAVALVERDQANKRFELFLLGLAVALAVALTVKTMVLDLSGRPSFWGRLRAPVPPAEEIAAAEPATRPVDRDCGLDDSPDDVTALFEAVRSRASATSDPPAEVEAKAEFVSRELLSESLRPWFGLAVAAVVAVYGGSSPEQAFGLLPIWIMSMGALTYSATCLLWSGRAAAFLWLGLFMVRAGLSLVFVHILDEEILNRLLEASYQTQAR
jgi:hypothetical protein